MESFLENLLLSILRGVSISADSLKISTADSSALNTVVKDMFNAVMLIGTGLTIAYFLIEINRKMMFERDDFTVKSAVAPLFKLAIVLFILENSWNIVQALVNAHNDIIAASADWGKDGAGKALGEITDLGGEHPFSSLGLVAKCIACLPMIIAWLVSCVCTFVYWYKSIGYKIEFLYRIGLTPVAFADVYSGNNSNMYRWFKGFFAFALYGAAFIIIPKITYRLVLDTYSVFWTGAGEKALSKDALENPVGMVTLIAGSGIWTFIKFVFLQLLAPIAAIGTISSVRQLTKEAFG